MKQHNISVFINIKFTFLYYWRVRSLLMLHEAKAKFRYNENALFIALSTIYI
jgi:hypothetical protein